MSTRYNVHVCVLCPFEDTQRRAHVARETCNSQAGIAPSGADIFFHSEKPKCSGRTDGLLHNETPDGECHSRTSPFKNSHSIGQVGRDLTDITQGMVDIGRAVPASQLPYGSWGRSV